MKMEGLDPYNLGLTNSAEAIPYLIRYLISGQKNQKRLSASALKKLSADHKEECKKATPYLLKCIQEEKNAPQVRQYSLAALKAIGVPYHAKKILQDVLENDKNEIIRVSARRLLSELGSSIQWPIFEIARERKIGYLFHFTRATNLSSIMTYGLCSRNKLDELSIPFSFNDKLRLDRHPETVSLSIGFPNYRMFYKYRKIAPVNWVVMAYKPDLLWEMKCAFCKHNAADKRITCKPIDDLTTADAFREMFLETNGVQSRADQKLKEFDPTDPQAEVLVFDTIPNSMLKGVVFRDKQAKISFKQKYPQYEAWTRSDNSSLFGTRAWMRGQKSNG